MTVEQLNVIITAQNTEFNRRLDEVNGRLNTMADTAQKSADKTYNVFHNLAGKIAALGIGKIIADSITEGMNAIESESLFETSLGQYADSAREWSEKLSDSLGLDDYALRKNIGTLYTMTKSMGVAKESALEMSQELSLLAEDMASFYNTSSEEAFAKLRSGLTGEGEPLKALGILVDENTVKQYAYKNGIAEVGEELTQTQKVLARYQAIMAQTSTAQGDLARTIDSPANQLRILKNEVKELMRDTGTTLMPTVSSLLGMARSGLELVTPLVTGLADGVNTVSQAIINSSPQTKTMLTLTLAMALAIPAVTKAQMFMTAAKSAYSALLNILIPKQLTYAAALKATAGWIGIIAAAIGIFSLINDANSAAATTTKDTADAFADEEAGAKAAADGVSELADSMDDLSKKTTKSLAAVDKLNIFQGVGSGNIGGLVSQTDFDMLDEYKTALDEVKNYTNDLSPVKVGIDTDHFYTSVSELNKGIANIFGEDWTNFWNSVGSNINKALFSDTEKERLEGLRALDNQFKTFFGTFGEWWSGFWSGVGSVIYDFANGDLEKGLSKIQQAYEGFFAAIDSMFGTHLAKWYTETSENLMQIGSEIYRNTVGWEQVEANRIEAEQGRLVQEMELAINDYLRQGLDAMDAQSKAEKEFEEKGLMLSYYWDRIDEGTARSVRDIMEDEKKIDAQMMDYTYEAPNYSSMGPMPIDLTAGGKYQIYPDPAGSPIVQNNITVEIDGEEVASYVVSQETRTEEASNGY